MKVVLIAPAAIAVPPLGYGGCEALVYNYAKALAERKDVEVTLIAPKFSYAPGVREVIETVDLNNPLEPWREDLAYKRYHKRLKEFDAIHDFSHRGLVGRLNSGLPQVKMLWHAYGAYPEPKYNLMSLSEWHAARMKEQYKQEVAWLNMGVPTDFYKPREDGQAGDYWCYLGHPAPTKGMTEAITYARKSNQKLHIMGGQVPAEGAQYRDRAMALCDGKQIIWLGEVSNERKRDELAGARGFLFPVQQDEGSSLALMEAMACGLPCITSNKGAYPEMISKDMGVCCKTEDEYLNILANKGIVESFDRKKIREYAVSNYGLNTMCDAYIELYHELADGLMWG